MTKQEFKLHMKYYVAKKRKPTTSAISKFSAKHPKAPPALGRPVVPAWLM